MNGLRLLLAIFTITPNYWRNKMVGDFILWLRKFLKQNFFCIHHYVWKGPLDFRYEKCDKCGKLKNSRYDE